MNIYFCFGLVSGVSSIYVENERNFYQCPELLKEPNP